MRNRRTSALAAGALAAVLAVGGSGAALAAQHGDAMHNGDAMMHQGKKHKHKKHGHAMHHGGAMHQ